MPTELLKADLHTHTTFSDGVLSPEALVEQARQAGLSGLCVTDHDCLDAYPALLAMQDETLKIIPGLEFSTHFESMSVHVLAYSLDIENASIHEAIETLKHARIERLDKILEKLAKRGVSLDKESLMAEHHMAHLTRAHVAHSLVTRGHCSSMQDAFDRFLNDKQLGNVTLKVFETEQAIDLIHQANGMAVLAHPHMIKKNNKLRRLVDLPFDGVEVFYSNLPQTIEHRMQSLAGAKGKFATGGSDFHRPNPYQRLGCSFTPWDRFEKLYELAKQNNPIYYQ